MELDQDTKDKLLAVIAGKPMQWMLVPDKWSDCSVAQALGWLGLTYMAKSVRIKPEPQVMCYPRETKEPEMKPQQTLMQFDPATGVERPYPSHAEQWRKYHGHMAWLFNPWTGTRRLAGDVGSDAFGLLVVPPDEPVPASNAPLESTEARYRDLLNRLGVQGHDGAVAEIESLRAGCGRMQGV